MNQQELDAAQAAHYATMNRDLDMIYFGAVTAYEQNLPVLPENIFVSYFLPYFAGQVAPVKHVPDWISIAGAPTQKVNIIDAAGAVLFTVPALLNTGHIQLLRPDGSLPFSSIISMANALKTQSPAQAQNLFINSMLERYRQVHNSDYMPTDVERQWMEIFIRYNVTPVGVSTVPGITAVKDDSDIDEDDFKIG